MAYKKIFRPYLFRQDPERIHERMLRLLKISEHAKIAPYPLSKIFHFPHSKLEVKTFGLTFKNPVGLAAGFDKDAKAVHGLSSLGFSHLELGTVTLLPQEGNPKPRIFRLREDSALINRMGFPSGGVEKFVKNLEKKKTKDSVIGINIGKGKDTPLEKAEEDYRLLLQNIYPWADYIVINISSPNTVGLRQLQAKQFLRGLMSRMKKTSSTMADGKKTKPILLKIAPDLNFGEIDDILEVVHDLEVSGIIATNTTVERGGLKSKSKSEKGGLSGLPLKQRSTEIIRYLYKKSRGKVAIIGVGGIASAEDAWEKILVGASLVQVYTGLVYEGPFLVKRINQGLAQKLEESGASSIEEVVGSEA